ncbi:MAG: undecaprenyl-phosphate glucose phosphotransferase [Hyphomicrobiaceae bacterium]|nr:undecaprenyl-phosphate glucose phosphotransferase [Hyphomicrobiaceae bacterium]
MATASIKDDPKARFRAAVHAARASASTFENAPLAGRSGHVELSPAAREVADLFADRPISPSVLTGMIRLFELTMVAAIGMIVYMTYVAGAFVFDLYYALPLISGALLTVVLIQAADGYNIGNLRTIVSQIGRIFAAWTMVFAFFATVAFFAKIGDYYSRVWFGTWYLAGLGFFFLFRFGLALVVRRWYRDGLLERRAVIIGGGQTAETLINALEGGIDSDIRICGIFDDRADDRSPPIVAGYPKLGNIAELVEFGRITQLDMLIVALPITAESRVLDLLKKLWVLPVDIRLSAHSNKLKFRPRSYSYVGTVPFLDVFDKPVADWDSIVKRVFDLVVGSLALVLLSPLMLAAAIAIKLDSKGPVFFRQKRHGFNNEVVSVWKFRSMYTDQCDHAARNVVTKGDPRVTRVGRFIRKTSIDELPQLFNVLTGELSLVGPRPHAVDAQTKNRSWESVVDGYYARHKVKPGITGWAQINGWRGEIDTPEKIQRRVEHDLYYIENWSVMFDIYILALTPIRLLNTENAY